MVDLVDIASFSSDKFMERHLKLDNFRPVAHRSPPALRHMFRYVRASAAGGRA
jgi:hypothetical protein